MYIPSLELFGLFLLPLITGAGYVYKVKPIELAIAYSYTIGIFVPSAVYFFLWLIFGVQFSLIYWITINVIVFVGGLFYSLTIKKLLNGVVA